MAEKIKVALVDDHPLYLAGLRQFVEQSADFELVGEGTSGADALAIAELVAPDLMLLDIDLPGGGIETAKAIARAAGSVKIILLTASDRQDHVAAALEAGARGYVLKGVTASELNPALHSVFNGDTYVTPGLATRLLINMLRAEPASLLREPTDLTPRELEILEMIGAGRTNKEIARELSISDKTVKHYLANIMQKLNVRNRVEAAMALQRMKVASE